MQIQSEDHCFKKKQNLILLRRTFEVALQKEA